MNASRPESLSANRAEICRPSGSLTCSVQSVAPSASTSTSSVPSPPSAIGHRSTERPALTSPAPIASATSVALNVPLNESGATSTVCGTPAIVLTPPVSVILSRDGRPRADRGRRGAGAALQPAEGLLPGARDHEARPGQLLPAAGGRDDQPPARSTDEPQAICRRCGRQAVLPEARARFGTGLVADRGGDVPQRAQCPIAPAQRPGAPGVGGE